MKCLSDIEIDVLAVKSLESSFIPPAEMQHIETCAFCRTRWKTTLNIYQPLPSLPKAPTQPLTLHPVSIPQPTQVHHRTVLAADSGSDMKARFVNTGVFSTEKENMIIRMMRDGQEKKTMLHILADDQTLATHACVTLKDVEECWLSNAQGVVTIPEELDINVEETSIQVRPAQIIRPLRFMPLENNNPPPQSQMITLAGELIPITITVRSKSNRRKWDVTLSLPKTCPNLYVALIGNDFQTPPLPIAHNTISFSAIPSLDNLAIHIY
ncbi:MAG: hypothetical protein ACE5D8_07785 [Fidelibacterota bacterium]